jgi:hypothetical protein
MSKQEMAAARAQLSFIAFAPKHEFAAKQA